MLAESLRSDAALGVDMSEEEVEMLFKSAPLHDIGKVGVPDAVLCKPGKLTDDEWALMRLHPAYGRDAIAAAGPSGRDSRTTARKQRAQTPSASAASRHPPASDDTCDIAPVRSTRRGLRVRGP